MPVMAKALLQATVCGLATIAAVLLGLWSAAGMAAAPGGQAAAIHVAANPLVVITIVLALLVALAALASVLGWLGLPNLGLFVAGLGLTAFAVRSGTAADLIREEGDLVWLAAEALAWAAVILIMSAVVHAVSGQQEHTLGTTTPGRAVTILRRGGLFGWALVLLPVVWLVARSELKGQVIAAASLGGVAFAMGAVLIARPAWRGVLPALPLVVAAAGYLIVGFREGGLGLVDLTAGLRPLALPMPQDYAAGALMGVSAGTVWGRSLLQESEQPAPEALDSRESHAGSESPGGAAAKSLQQR